MILWKKSLTDKISDHVFLDSTYQEKCTENKNVMIFLIDDWTGVRGQFPGGTPEPFCPFSYV